MSTLRTIFLLLIGACLLHSCAPSAPQGLPILGEKDLVDGKDVYHAIPDFSFMNQDSQMVNNATFAGKAYVVDFFFIKCPTICPKVTKQMLRVHDAFANEPSLLFLSHTIDPKHDDIPALKLYATNLGVKTEKWHFVNGPKDDVYAIADDYFSIAKEDPDAPGGFDHSGRLILVDKNRNIRSFCDGTDVESVDRFIQDIQLLMQEK